MQMWYYKSGHFHDGLIFVNFVNQHLTRNWFIICQMQIYVYCCLRVKMFAGKTTNRVDWIAQLVEQSPS